MADDEVTTEADAAARESEHKDRLHGVPVTGPIGERTLHPDRAGLVELVTDLAEDGYRMCLDVTGVDYLTHPGRELPEGIAPERFEVVVHLIDHERRERLRIRVQVPEDDPTVPSIVGVHAGAEAPERETYDLYGITFTDHPDLTRILMPEDWDGHPLRKDEGVGAIPVQFKQAGREVRS